MSQKKTTNFSGMDKYAFNARLKPAFFSVLPALVLTIVHFPKIWIQASALLALLTTCGVLFLLMQISRQKGRDVEKKLGSKVGRAHTAQLLAYSDKTLPEQLKRGVRAIVASKSNIELATEQDEQEKDVEAQASRLAAVYWLIEFTRPSAKETLLHDENISYGFRRNLFGLKPIGATVAIFCTALNPLLVFFTHVPIDNLPLYIALELALILSCMIWLYTINEAFVEDASFSYAQRLFSICLIKNEND